MTSAQVKLQELLETVKTADVAVMDVYDSRSAVVTIKTDSSPLTQADIAAHQIIYDGLSSLFPEIPVVSEEGSETENLASLQADKFWLVDPIDGTREFLARTNHFTICVALIEHGVPTFGIISAPALDVTYYGGEGLGCFKRSSNASALPIKVSSSRVGVILGSRTDMNDATKHYISEHYPNSELKAVGSQLKLPQIAEGLADAYPRLGSGLHHWDLAAGHAILSAAGGEVRRPDGSPIDYRAGSFLAGDFVATSFRS